MIAKRFSRGAVLAGAVLALACGEGRVIFNVDVYSFLKGVGQDSVPYLAPSPLPDTIPAQSITVFPTALDKSIVESVYVSGAVDFVNQTGTGAVGFRLYIDTVQTVYADSAYSVALDLAPVAVTPGATSTGTFQSQNVPAVLNRIFLKSTAYVGMRAIATASSGTVIGQARLSALRLRIVIQDKIF